MKAIKLFSMAVLAIMMAACSEQDNDITQQPAEAPGVIHFTGSISTKNDNATRTTITDPNDGSKTLNVAWKLGETIYLFQGKGDDEKQYGEAAITYVDETNGSAIIEGALTVEGYDLSKDFTLKFLGDYISEAYLNAALKNQRGTLARLGDYDYRLGSAKLVYDNERAKYVIDGLVDMKSQIAIWKFTQGIMSKIEDQLRVFSNGDLIAASGTNFDGSNNTTVYLAVPAVEKKAVTVVHIESIIEDKPNAYIFTKEGVTLKPAYYYQSEVPSGDGALILGNLRILTPQTGDLTLQNGDIVMGTGGADTHVAIAADANVTLIGVDITSISSNNSWAGITCAGNATITVKGTNKVKGGNANYPGIQVASSSGAKLQLTGSGKLEASSNGDGWSAGIGSASNGSCGDIEILDGVEITATSGSGAGIGSGMFGSCGNITISGATTKVTAECGGAIYSLSAGIGSAYEGSCGNITISGSTIIATGGVYAPGIGARKANGGTATCGEITFEGGTVTATAGGGAPTAIGKGKVDDTGTSTCTSVRIKNDITSLAMKNTNAAHGSSGSWGILGFGDFIQATSVFINDTNSAFGYAGDVTINNPDLVNALNTAGFETSYTTPGSTMTWTWTKHD